MIEFPYEYSNLLYCRPPGTLVEGVNSGNTLVAIVQHHRFAFFYWNFWSKEKKMHPDLFSIDHHHDLCPPEHCEVEDLNGLDTSNDERVSQFCWARLRSTNDSQTLSAVYLDILSDVHVECKMHWMGKNHFDDKDGRPHNVRVYDDHSKFLEWLSSSSSLILDLDMDYFLTNYDEDVREKVIWSPQDVVSRISFVKSNWKKIKGITIATEPTHCGGILNSYELLRVILTYLRT